MMKQLKKSNKLGTKKPYLSEQQHLHEAVIKDVARAKEDSTMAEVDAVKNPFRLGSQGSTPNRNRERQTIQARPLPLNRVVTKSRRAEQTTLYHPVRWHSSWKSSTTVLPTVEIDDKTSMTIVCNKPGVPDPMKSQPETMENEISEFFQRRSIRSGQIGTPISTIQHYRDIAVSSPRFSLTNICGSRKGQDQTHPELPTHQPIHTVSSFQNGRRSCPEGHYRITQLDMQNRSEGCLYGGTDTQGLSEMSIIFTLRYSGW
ncbi:hypothetical protein G6F56_003377 [Rhizopus delemar]|nr:hypothetical protein G6F56_003377 [Rhizopus delemar]